MDFLYEFPGKTAIICRVGNLLRVWCCSSEPFHPLTRMKLGGPPSLGRRGGGGGRGREGGEGWFEPAAPFTGCFTRSGLTAKLLVWKAIRFCSITG